LSQYGKANKCNIMKIIVFSFLLLGNIASGFAQGSIEFRNASSAIPDGLDRLVRFDASASAFNPFGTNYAPVVSNLAPGLRAQLYYGSTSSTESQLIPVTNAPATFRSSISLNAGAWLGDRVFVDVPLQGQYPYNYMVANLQVRVWDVTQASTYETALTDPSYNGLIGKSAMFTQTYYWWPFDSGLTELRSFTIGEIPEPSSLGLAGLTAVSLLLWMWRRKKSHNLGT
jgi:hypothetical protein